MELIRKILCFLGIHRYEHCDECEVKSNVSIMIKCERCGKISSEN